MQKLNILIFIVFTLNLCVAQNKWIWSKTKANQEESGYYPLADRQSLNAKSQYARADRDREPTTKRPIPGLPQNDDIDDDYTDANDETSRQNNPYIPPGTNGHPINGFGNYPQFNGLAGNAPNGILVGPGGPTGVIGRPHAQYPANYPGYPGAPVNNHHEFPGYTGHNNVLTQYPGQPSFAIPNNHQQFAGAQYPQIPFPGIQYPQQPHYTEGYGLANLYAGFNENSGFNINPAFNGYFNPNYGFGLDEYPVKLESKSASIRTIDKKVDDKVTKNLKKL